MKKLSRRAAMGALIGLGVSVLLGGRAGAADAPKEGASGKPSVKLLVVPKIEPGPEKTAELKGRVSGLPSFKGYRVAIYSKGGSVWWVQPTAAEPLTEIEDDGDFAADVHGGTEYAVLLVKEGYKAKAQLESLPQKPGGEVIALARKRPGKPVEESAGKPVEESGK